MKQSKCSWKFLLPSGHCINQKNLVAFIFNKTSKFKVGVGSMNLKSYSTIPNTIPRILMNQLKDKNKDTHVYYTESHNSKWLKTIAQEEEKKQHLSFKDHHHSSKSR